MGSPKAASEALAAATVKWREYRQPVVGTAATLKKHEAAEREAQFRLANAALLWLWHREHSAAPPPPAGVDRPETEGEKIARDALEKAREYLSDHMEAQPNDETRDDLARIDEALRQLSQGAKIDEG